MQNNNSVSVEVVYHCKCVYYIDSQHKFEAIYKCPTRRHVRFLAADFVMLHSGRQNLWVNVLKVLTGLDQWEHVFDKGFIQIQIVAQVK